MSDFFVIQVSFSQCAKIAILRILTDIINADGRIDERETLLFGKLKKDFNLSEKGHKVALEKNSLLTLVQIKNLNEEQKKNGYKDESDDYCR